MFAGMELRFVFCFFLWAFCLESLVHAAVKGSGFSFFPFHRSNHSVKFSLYNRQNNKSPIAINVAARRRSLFPSFKNDKPIKVVIHGWLGNDAKRFNLQFRESLLKYEDVNVITVDWSGDGSQNILYPVARSRVPEVAATVAEFLDDLNRQHGVKLEDLHVLGHSLGAHIAGLAGNKVTTGKIGRITGLDPAGPCFSVNKPNERLSNTSAIFVDVIHTCGKYLGLNAPIGHADFYPNSGCFLQPGCGLDVGGACSHRRSYYYYIESLENRKAFPAVPCPSWKNYKNNNETCDIGHKVYMGEGVSTSSRGMYFLKTKKESPFGMGDI